MVERREEAGRAAHVAHHRTCAGGKGRMAGNGEWLRRLRRDTGIAGRKIGQRGRFERYKQVGGGHR